MTTPVKYIPKNISNILTKITSFLDAQIDEYKTHPMDNMFGDEEKAIELRCIDAINQKLKSIKYDIRKIIVDECMLSPDNYLSAESYVQKFGLSNPTAYAVDGFAEELAKKLAKSAEKYGHGDSWMESDWKEKCTDDLYRHMDEGDPIDVAAYCMFIWAHREEGWSTKRIAAEQKLKGGV